LPALACMHIKKQAPKFQEVRVSSNKLTSLPRSCSSIQDLEQDYSLVNFIFSSQHIHLHQQEISHRQYISTKSGIHSLACCASSFVPVVLCLTNFFVVWPWSAVHLVPCFHMKHASNWRAHPLVACPSQQTFLWIPTFNVINAISMIKIVVL